MPAWEAAQLLLGLAIPPMLTSHVVGTRLAHAWYGQADPYHRVALVLWELRPWLGIKQSVVLTLAWLHGSIGLHFWLRLWPWYPRVVPLLFAVAVLLPTLALLGFAQAGREAAALARLPGGAARLLEPSPRLGAAERAVLDRVERDIYTTFAGLLALALIARAGRRFYVRRWRAIAIAYQGGPEVRVPIGFSILEASRFAQSSRIADRGQQGRPQGPPPVEGRLRGRDRFLGAGFRKGEAPSELR